MEQMLILLMLMLAGFLASKCRVIDADGNKKLSKLLLYVTQPAMILAAAMSSEARLSVGDVLRFFLYACIMYAVLIVMALLLSKLFRLERSKKNVYRFMMIFGNVMFMGFPVVSALYGSQAVLIASIYGIPFNIIIYTVGVLMISGGGGQKLSWRPLLNPGLIATLASLIFVFAELRVPRVIYEAANTLGSMTVPGAMLVIGITLGNARIRDMFADKYIYLLCLIKLIAAPAAVWAVCRFFIQDPMYLGILIILSAMPVASLASMLSMEYGGDCETASRGIFVTTILSVLTTPLMVYLLVG